jgi:hypothetical protein
LPEPVLEEHAAAFRAAAGGSRTGGARQRVRFAGRSHSPPAARTRSLPGSRTRTKRAGRTCARIWNRSGSGRQVAWH